MTDTVVNIEYIQNLQDISRFKEITEELGIKCNGNAGIETFRDRVLDYLKSVEPAPMVESTGSDIPLHDMDPTKIVDVMLRRRVVLARSMRQSRIKLHPLCPADSTLNGAMPTVINKYTGRVTKFIPFDKPWHVPQLLLTSLEGAIFNNRVKKRGTNSYKTVRSRRYQVEYLDPLTDAQREQLMLRQLNQPEDDE